MKLFKPSSILWFEVTNFVIYALKNAFIHNHFFLTSNYISSHNSLVFPLNADPLNQGPHAACHSFLHEQGKAMITESLCQYPGNCNGLS